MSHETECKVTLFFRFTQIFLSKITNFVALKSMHVNLLVAMLRKSEISQGVARSTKAFFNAMLVVGVVLCFVSGFTSCNKDQEIGALAKPVIEFSEPSGIYSVRVGHELCLEPQVENADGATFEWSVDGRIVGRDPSFVSTWNVPGEYYLLLTVENAAGVAREEVLVTVLDATPPTISLSLPEFGLKLLPDQSRLLAPRYQHSDMEGFSVRWMVDGVEVADTPDYEFCRSETRSYSVCVIARNVDGESRLEFTVDVVHRLPSRLVFPPLSATSKTSDRYVFAGQTVMLCPYGEYVDTDQYVWSVNGVPADGKNNWFKFSPTLPGEYIVEASTDQTSAQIRVVCVDGDAALRFRPAQASSSSFSTVVYEWLPAPGQFIGDVSSVGGMTADIATPDAACRWAQQRLDTKRFVSLGAWGGYLVVGFDHSIRAGHGDYDFIIGGNASDTSNEPGIVWVMQDANGNGLPDDEWYQLRGSAFDDPSTLSFYAATYYRPAGQRMAVEWTDNLGASGLVEWMGASHTQPHYYPAWVETDRYTLYGPRLQARSTQNPVTGHWTNPPFSWGYADNLGSDLLSDADMQACGFKISNAVLPDGSPVALDYIDFVKVQTGVMGKSGLLGEISTEVFFVEDVSI